MEFIKKYWAKILFVLVVIFALNKCTVACNRSSKINENQKEIAYKDSIINSQRDSLNILKVRWNDAKENQSTYQGIALDTKQELLNQINLLTNEINTLKSKNNLLTNENNKLKKEIQQLKK